ncbi:hypothetical protein ES332_A09G167400v1 [Gossypium tomentosum]|uniref:Uncharacterized protein n=1 Tax=Gossypium tomentosum TaxID=34277 RepID=A0A5D2P3D4_GOSTO|nr:hypothetical protein ES332_A09G167400v1 [Gossypium tomentosum]
MSCFVNSTRNKQFFNNSQRIPFYDQALETHLLREQKRPFTCSCFSNERISNILYQISYSSSDFPS